MNLYEVEVISGDRNWVVADCFCDAVQLFMRAYANDKPKIQSVVLKGENIIGNKGVK